MQQIRGKFLKTPKSKCFQVFATGLTQSRSMDIYYTGQFVLPLPERHRFPMAKYHMLRDRLVAEYAGIDMKTASPASDGMLALAHTPEYIRELTSGSIATPAMREIGFP